MSCGFDYLGFPVDTKVKFCNGWSDDYSYTAWVQSGLWCLRKTIHSFSHMQNWDVDYLEFTIDWKKTCNRNRTFQPCSLSVSTVVLNYNNFLISCKTDSCSIYLVCGKYLNGEKAKYDNDDVCKLMNIYHMYLSLVHMWTNETTYIYIYIYLKHDTWSLVKHPRSEALTFDNYNMFI